MFTRKNWTIVATLIMVVTLILPACQAAPASEPVEVTRVVYKEGTPEVITEVVTATPEPTPEPGKEKVLRIHLNSSPDLIDPQQSSFNNEIAHLSLIYQGLTAFDENLETIPAAAESWEYNEDATEITFHLREGLKYSDGTPVTADRFEYALKRAADPRVAGEYQYIVFDIEGAEEFGTANVEELSDEELDALRDAMQVKALDAKTLWMKLTHPAPYWHTVMGLWVAYPARKEMIEAGGDLWWQNPEYQVGNGPFILESFEEQVKCVLRANPNYWAGRPKVDKIEFHFIPDTAVAFEAYKNDELDIAILAAEDLATIMADPVLSKEAMVEPGTVTMAVMFHNLRPPFDNKLVREAFTYAFDREGWCNDILHGLGTPTLQWIPPGVVGYDPSIDMYDYDVEKARAKLKEAGYNDPQDLGEIVITYPSSPRNQTRFEWLANMWQQNLGVTIALDPVEPTTFTALTKDVNTTPLVYILGWIQDYPDPQNWLSVYWTCGAFGERIGYCNEEFDSLCSLADAELDPEKRVELYQEAQRVLIGDCPGAFAYNRANSYLVKPWVKDIGYTPMDAAWPGQWASQTTVDIDLSMLP